MAFRPIKVMLFGFMLTSASGLLQADEPAPALTGFADVRSAGVQSDRIRWSGPADDAERRLPGHPPIDEIPAMPFPDPALRKPGASGPGRAVEFDAGLGQEIEWKSEQGTERENELDANRSEGGGGADGYRSPFGVWDSEDSGLRGFGTMTEVGDDSAFPWRMNAKLVMRFVDNGGTDRFFVCSGTMADWETVLTAGHCIYAFTPGGFQINDWAAEVWVYPGWDGSGQLGSDQILQHFGVGRGNQYRAFTGWTEDGNFDWDMGLIRIRRAVGALTGWFGYQWGGSCSDIRSRRYHLASYPAEGCGTTGLHNGQDMYYWNGDYDGCAGNLQQLELDTTAGCFTAQWGGMSGGGSYLRTDTDNRRVHAVVSNSDNATFANHTRMWGSFKDSMLNFEAGSRGSTFDLQLLRARYAGNTVQAGGSLEGDDYLLVNPTDADEPNRAYSITHYLSTNDTISTADTALRTESITWDFERRQTLTANNTGTFYTIPIDVPSGTYFIGAEINSSDGNSGNNDGSGWDAQQITVQGVADLVAEMVDPESGLVFIEEFLDVDYRYRNQGGERSNTVLVKIQLSTNSTITAFDTLLASFSESALKGQATRSDSALVGIPFEVEPGPYYLGLAVESSDDVDSGNNSVAASIPIDVVGRSDLRAIDIAASSSNYRQDDNVSYSFEIANWGAGDSGPFDYRVVLSRDAVLTGLDPVVASFSNARLASGEKTGSTTSFTLDPGTIAPGEYVLGLIVDPGDYENDLGDNEAVSATITVAENCTAGAACLMFEDSFEN